MKHGSWLLLLLTFIISGCSTSPTHQPAGDATLPLSLAPAYAMGYTVNQVRAAIMNGNWNVVVLQEQSTRPVDDPELMYQFADSLCTFIRTVRGCILPCVPSTANSGMQILRASNGLLTLKSPMCSEYNCRIAPGSRPNNFNEKP
ncbi:MAG: hypothetical protein J7K89_04000 [Candidatus Cloacimonetes bacterium]|nr:hypothetical protein [Candidatus Cloacimonadota bacterium]